MAGRANLELDHVFMFADPATDWVQALSSLGFIETYRRRHPGQGTANACYCFDNAFLEILWIEDDAEASSDAIRRCQFAARSQWPARRECNPFGIAWRGRSAVCTWAYRPPYLPAQTEILVATDSDDLALPFMFTFPGTTAPHMWQAERRGALQAGAGFSTLAIELVSVATGVDVTGCLRALADEGCIEQVVCGAQPSIIVRMERRSGPALRIRLPDFAIV